MTVAMQLVLLGIGAALLLVACGGSPDEVVEHIPIAPTAVIAASEPTHDPVPNATSPLIPTATYPPDLLQGISIALDAGHGGEDEGAMGYCVDVEVLEADVNLRTREMLQEHLDSVGATVYLVPQPPEREQRVLAAESAGADILVSIHHNGYDDPAENYTTTFVSDEADWALALEIHPLLIKSLALTDSGIQFEEFGITHFGSLPAVLTEATFITNGVEACNFLGSQSRIRAEALALFHGVVAYFTSG